MSDDAYNYWAGAVKKVYDSAEWKKTMASSGLAPLDLTGKAFQSFVTKSVGDIEKLSKEIGLIK